MFGPYYLRPSNLVLLKVIFYFWPFLRAFWELFFIFSRVLKQIQVSKAFKGDSFYFFSRVLEGKSKSNLRCLRDTPCFEGIGFVWDYGSWDF